MKETKIFLVRHGQSMGNATRVYLGHTNLGITERGEMQAKLTAEALRDEKIDAIYSSDLKRAHDTAIPHSIIHNLPINDRVNLREINIGVWEGMKIDDMLRDYHEEFTVGWQENFATFTPPGGECVRAAGERFFRELESIAKDHPGQTVLVTTHAAVIRSFWGIINNLTNEQISKELPFPANASYSIVTYKDGVFTPVKFSVNDHIPGEDIPLI